jgi:hypothetical protein
MNNNKTIDGIKRLKEPFIDGNINSLSHSDIGTSSQPFKAIYSDTVVSESINISSANVVNVNTTDSNVINLNSTDANILNGTIQNLNVNTGTISNLIVNATTVSNLIANSGTITNLSANLSNIVEPLYYSQGNLDIKCDGLTITLNDQNELTQSKTSFVAPKFRFNTTPPTLRSDPILTGSYSQLFSLSTGIDVPSLTSMAELLGVDQDTLSRTTFLGLNVDEGQFQFELLPPFHAYTGPFQQIARSTKLRLKNNTAFEGGVLFFDDNHNLVNTSALLCDFASNTVTIGNVNILNADANSIDVTTIIGDECSFTNMTAVNLLTTTLSAGSIDCRNNPLTGAPGEAIIDYVEGDNLYYTNMTAANLLTTTLSAGSIDCRNNPLTGTPGEAIIDYVEGDNLYYTNISSSNLVVGSLSCDEFYHSDNFYYDNSLEKLLVNKIDVETTVVIGGKLSCGEFYKSDKFYYQNVDERLHANRIRLIDGAGEIGTISDVLCMQSLREWNRLYGMTMSSLKVTNISMDNAVVTELTAPYIEGDNLWFDNATIGNLTVGNVSANTINANTINIANLTVPNFKATNICSSTLIGLNNLTVSNLVSDLISTSNLVGLGSLTLNSLKVTDMSAASIKAIAAEGTNLKYTNSTLGNIADLDDLIYNHMDKEKGLKLYKEGGKVKLGLDLNAKINGGLQIETSVLGNDKYISLDNQAYNDLSELSRYMTLTVGVPAAIEAAASTVYFPIGLTMVFPDYIVNNINLRQRDICIQGNMAAIAGLSLTTAVDRANIDTLRAIVDGADPACDVVAVDSNKLMMNNSRTIQINNITNDNISAGGIIINTNFAHSSGSIVNESKLVSGVGKFGTSSNHPFVITSNNGDRMYFNTTGAIGVGTTSPSVLFDVNGTAKFVNALSTNTTTTNLSSDSGTINNLHVPNFSASNLRNTNGVFTNLCVGNIASPLTIGNLVAPNFSASNLRNTNGVFTNVTLSNLVGISASSIAITHSTFVNTVVTNLSVGTLSGFNLSNISSSNLVATNISSTSTRFTDSVSTNISSSNAVITNLSVGTLSGFSLSAISSSNLAVTNLTSENAIINNLTIGSFWTYTSNGNIDFNTNHSYSGDTVMANIGTDEYGVGEISTGSLQCNFIKVDGFNCLYAFTSDEGYFNRIEAGYGQFRSAQYNSIVSPTIGSSVAILDHLAIRSLTGTTTESARITMSSQDDVYESLLLDSQGSFQIRTQTEYPIEFFTNNTHRMTLTSAGNLNIGSTGSQLLVGNIGSTNTSSANSIITNISATILLQLIYLQPIQGLQIYRLQIL